MNETKRPVLCVVAGPNGSGKTTTTSLLLSNEWTADCEYINPDNIAKDSFGDWNSPDAVLAIEIVDRAYIYDNSIDNLLPQLVCRTVNGTIHKQYSDTLPEWVKAIISK